MMVKKKSIDLSKIGKPSFALLVHWFYELRLMVVKLQEELATKDKLIVELTERINKLEKKGSVSSISSIDSWESWNCSECSVDKSGSYGPITKGKRRQKLCN